MKMAKRKKDPNLMPYNLYETAIKNKMEIKKN